jgi:hypothetical protein
MRRKRCAAGSGKTQAAGRARPYCAIICRSVVAPLSEPERSFIDRIPGLWAAIAAGEFLATWRSGYAAVCKTVYPGSIPGVASNIIKYLEIRDSGDPLAGDPAVIPTVRRQCFTIWSNQMSALSRRSLVTTAAAWPALAMPAVASATAGPDPIYAANEAHHAAFVRKKDVLSAR